VKPAVIQHDNMLLCDCC